MTFIYSHTSKDLKQKCPQTDHTIIQGLNEHVPILLKLLNWVDKQIKSGVNQDPNTSKSRAPFINRIK